MWVIWVAILIIPELIDWMAAFTRAVCCNVPELATVKTAYVFLTLTLAFAFVARSLILSLPLAALVFTALACLAFAFAFRR